ncbi:zinc finger CCCH domain-containing protein 17-like [Rhododendron vialii]|uniref:zinc finger CCCH domain-containing protein 17-like n=1 Tax=Rhododendron vialii TaxID=182163 RepID=UPI0026604652|nr:zinc finger CCCH domain-containing protein 17-like [Rhododendron vialii]XP_058224754.1 zinc finger CCCH domain-containing protein 17-like [Rhododendron vialii]
MKAARRFPERTQRSVFDRIKGGTVNNVCAYWLAGRCTRNPCRFFHPESLPSQPPKQSPYQHPKTWRRSPEDGVKNSSISPGGVAAKKMSSSSPIDCERKTPEDGVKNSSVSPCGVAAKKMSTPEDRVKNSSVSPSGVAAKKMSSISPSDCDDKSTPTNPDKVCKYWLLGNCVQGEKCKNLHSWFCGNGFSMLAKLEGHNKAVNGIALPCDSSKLYSGGKDNTVRVWDCHTGQCVNVVNLSGEVGSLISEGPWVFVGLPNSIKVWNSQTQTELTLDGPVGQVYAMAVGNDVLFAGTQDGTILAWKPSSETNGLDLAASLKGHSGGVISLCVGAKRLYSGSMDNTIRVWDLNTFECIHTLKGHTDAVMSVLCWASFLLSSSLDGTIKAWAATESGNIEVIHTHKEEHGCLELCGIQDAEEKPILLCSCNDNTVRLYDLPSFTERGRIFAKQEVRAIQIGPAGLFFTGDATGQLTVWKLAGEPIAVAS